MSDRAASDESLTATGDEPGGPGAAFEDIILVTGGPVDPAAEERARDMIRRLIETASRPILFARVKIFVEDTRPDPERAVVQATLDVNGSLIRAETAGSTALEAINLLQDRMQRRLRRVQERLESRRQRPASTPEGEWRRGDLPTSRPSFYPRPQEERRILRRKSYTPHAISVEEAIFDLEILDHHFLLFRDEVDGADSLLYESDGTVKLRRAAGGEPPLRPDRPVPVEYDPTPAPLLSDDEARELLDTSGSRMVYYRNAANGRGTAIYHRYDGHYGVVAPPD